MLTVDYTRLPITPGCRVLDVGCGAGRHAFEALRRGARVVAVDRDAAVLGEVARMGAAMLLEGQAPPGSSLTAVCGDVLALPFDDGAFDVVIAAEVLEHIPQDSAAMRELARVLAPGGVIAVTVPRWFPERVCWALSEEYHSVDGGHVRIYRRGELRARLRGAGFEPDGSHHHAHALHSPYWWLRCAIGMERGDAWIARQYHRFLVYDLMHRPRWTRALERALDPLLGKSLVVYARRPAGSARGEAA